MRNVPHITKKNRAMFEDSLRSVQSDHKMLGELAIQPVIHSVEEQRFVFLSEEDVSAYIRVVDAALDWQKR